MNKDCIYNCKNYNKCWLIIILRSVKIEIGDNNNLSVI